MLAVHLYWIIPALLIFAISFNTHSASGHGLGGETLPPVIIAGKNATMSIFVTPPEFNSKNKEYNIVLKLYETNTQAVISHVTYQVQISHDGKQLLDEKFHDDSSNLTLKVIPQNTDSIKMSGNDLGDLGWTPGFISPLQAEGPLFLSGGLYKFKIQVLTVDDDSNKLNPPVTFDAAISLAQTTDHKISYEKNDYLLGIVSYYDKIEDFGFDSASRKISFSMPYEWTEKNIAQTNVVHEEIHIPKTFPELLVTKYDVSVNGIKISDSSVTVDDYTSDSRVVHLVLYQKQISSMANSISDKSKMAFTITPSKDEKFPITAFTRNAIFEVGLSWEPAPIESGKKTRFYVDISRYFAPRVQEGGSFDFVIKQHGKELLRKTIDGKIGVSEKTNFADFEFSDKNLGPTVISIEKIKEEELSTVDFVVAVNPADTRKTFPIRIPSVSLSDSTGNYFVDMTWIPENLQPGQTEFIFTIYDKNLQPVPQASYDFVLIQNGIQVYKKSNTAKAGGSFEDVTFFDKNKGPMELRLENIDKSGEYASLPIAVTPEFPLGWYIVLALMFFVVLMPNLLRKTKIQNLFL